MLTHYQRALSQCQPYLLATRPVKPLLEMKPLGIDLEQVGLVIDPQSQRNEQFLHLLQRLDRLAFGPLQMAMPQWVFYDAGVMPSAIFGFCGPAESLEPWVRRAMNVPKGYDGPVPLTIFIAIPMVEQGSWFTHTLTSLNQVCMGTAAPAGLSMLSLCLGIRVLKSETLYGTTQWRSNRLRAFVSLGPLEVITAYTPNHSAKNTLTWRVQLQRPLVEAALISPGTSTAAPAATHLLDIDDSNALAAVQSEIEQGVRYHIVAPPTTRGSIVQCPVRRSVPR